MKSAVASGIGLITIALIPGPSLANMVDSKVHELCAKTLDYAGCVKAQTGQASNSTITNINIDGGVQTSGNSCPQSFYYAGSGYCEKVVCVYRGLNGKGHGQGLGGKGTSCHHGKEMTWTGETVRASNDPKCPPGEPERGYQSTCHQAADKGYIMGYGVGFRHDKDGVIEKVFGEPAKSAGVIEGDRIISSNGVPFKERPKTGWKNIESELTKTYVLERDGRKNTYTLKSQYQKLPLD